MRVRAGLALLLALATAMMPATSFALPGGDGSRPSGKTLFSSAGADLHYIPPVGVEGGRGPDPDTWDNAIESGKIYGTMKIAATSETAPPGTEGSCTQHDLDISTPPFDLPTMWIDSSPSPPRDDGLGGVVNIDTAFWVANYDGGEVPGPSQTDFVRNCFVDRSDPGHPRWQAQVESHTVQVAYRAGGVPSWDWGDGTDFKSGWSGPSTHHTYEVSSARCNRDTCLDVPVKGPSYVVSFSLDLTVELIVDGVTSTGTVPTSRHRAYPVREVQSILAR